MTGPIALTYHDVVPDGDWDQSGFPGASAASYKLGAGEFAAHLDAISQAAKRAPGKVAEVGATDNIESPFVLTFDDGGDSASKLVANCLENRGWYGHFLVTTNYIDTPGFVSSGQIRSLGSAGHVIGSHSCSHPKQMSSLTWNELVKEWGKSVEVLSSILGEPVHVASVAGGYYCRRVGKAAAFTGIKVLFTSEPTTKCWDVEGCLVMGRYTVRRGMPARTVADFAAGKLSPRLKQFFLWNCKKAAKSLGGELYLRMRQLYYKTSARNAPKP